MVGKQAHKQRKEMIMLIGGLVIVVLCITAVAGLILLSLQQGQTIPEYYFTIFISIATLIIGYTLGHQKNG